MYKNFQILFFLGTKWLKNKNDLVWIGTVWYGFVQIEDYISGCGAFSFNSQSVSVLQAYLLLELFSSSQLAETSGKCPLVFSVNRVVKPKYCKDSIPKLMGF